MTFVSIRAPWKRGREEWRAQFSGFLEGFPCGLQPCLTGSLQWLQEIQICGYRINSALKATPFDVQSLGLFNLGQSYSHD